MRRARVLWLRLRSLFRQGQVDRELDSELQFHLEQQIRENLANGMTPDEARLAARRSLGGVDQIVEACRDTRRVGVLLDLARDVRYGWRMLARNRVFAIVAVATLALGIGATTAIFSVVNGVLLQPLPYPDPGRIVSVGTRWTDTGRETARLTGPDFLDLRDAMGPRAEARGLRTSEEGEGRGLRTADEGEARGLRTAMGPRAEARDLRSSPAAGFDAISAYWGGEIGVQVAGTGEFCGVYWVHPDFFRVFSIRAAQGRTFTVGDGDRAAVVATGFAARVFGSPARALGATIDVEDQAYEIVGVLPAGFAEPRRTEVWLPMPMLPGLWSGSRTAFNFFAVARLAPGVSLPRAQAQIESLGARLARAYPDSNRSRTFALVPLRDRVVAPVRSTLWMLLGWVVLVLVNACVNVANLLLARATTRAHEIALRGALGAGRWRIIRQLSAESLLLALVGGALGLALAYVGTGALLRLAPENLPRLNEVVVDWRVLAFAAACSVVASLVFGLAPAWQASQIAPHDGLRQASGRGVLAGRSTRVRSLLVVAEIALSFALAVGGGLLFRSFVALTRADLGFRQDSVLVVTAHRPAKGLEEYVRVARFFSEIGSDFSTIPGVKAAGAAMGLPTGPYGSNGSYSVEGREPAAGGRAPQALFGLVSPGYFAALGVPRVAGRDFTAGDRYDAPFVAIVSQALARETFPGEDPIGRRLRCGLDAPDKWMTIVGVIGDVRQDSPGSAPGPQIYMPLQQHPYHANEVEVVLRTAAAPASLVPAVRARMQQRTPETALKFATLEQMVGASIGTQRFRTLLVGVFAVIALLLSTAGVYGVMSYLTAQRTAEFGLRVALGARRRELFGLVLARAARLAASGLALGVALSIAGGRLVQTMLFGLEPLDPVTYAATLALLALVVLAAAAAPAWHAARIDPIAALRQE